MFSPRAVWRDLLYGLARCLLQWRSSPSGSRSGGTLVIPGHGRICDQTDVVNYRDMVTIVRDRIPDLIGKGMSLEQVLAARPTRDYDPRYGSEVGPEATLRFVHSVYLSLTEEGIGAAEGA